MHDGYCNWKKALGKDGRFKTQENSECYRLANTTYSSSACPNVIGLMSEQHIQQKKENRRALDIILATIKLCGRQDLAIRSHTDENRNLIQLLNLAAKTSLELKNWLSEKNLMQYLSDQILKN